MENASINVRSTIETHQGSSRLSLMLSVDDSVETGVVVNMPNLTNVAGDSHST